MLLIILKNLIFFLENATTVLVGNLMMCTVQDCPDSKVSNKKIDWELPARQAHHGQREKLIKCNRI